MTWDLPKGDWALDPSHTTIGAVARHMVFTKVRGKFNDFEGEVVIGEGPEDSRVGVRIKADSIDTGVEARDEHLRSPDFLDTAAFPELVFESTSVEQPGADVLKVTGNLTIHGVNKPLTLDVKYEGSGVDPWGGTRAIFSASTEFDREEFGMTWNQVLEAGGVLVSKKLQIEIEAQAVQPQEAAA